MVGETKTCSVCNTAFELHFRYQTESGGNGGTPRFFCSQRCLEASHTERSDGSVSCDACAKNFHVELASQVLFTGGRRHYACSLPCRQRVLSGVREKCFLTYRMNPAHDEVLVERTAGRRWLRIRIGELA